MMRRSNDLIFLVLAGLIAGNRDSAGPGFFPDSATAHRGG